LDWIGYFLRRNCLLKHVIEGKIEQTRRRGRRLQQLLDKRKEKRRYRKLTEEALSRALRSICLGRVHGYVVRQTVL